MQHRHKRLLALTCNIVLVVLVSLAQAGPTKAMVGGRGPGARGQGMDHGSPAPDPRSPALSSQRIDLALVGGTLIDGRGGAPIPNAVVTISGDRIVAVGRAGEVGIPRGTPTRNLQGKTILPGFINAHVHTNLLADQALKGWTRAGVTTVLDLAGPPDRLLARRKMIAASGDATYPRFLVAGPFITVPGGHPIPRNGQSDEVVAVRGPDDARAKVTALLDAGVDLIKIVVSGRTDVKWPELSDAEIRAITATAHARGVRVIVHIDRSVALRRAVEQGVDASAHMPRDRMPDDLIALMVARNVVLVPTIDVYETLAEGRGLGEDWRRWTMPVMHDNLRRFARAGGTLALGDDYGGWPGVALGMPMAEIDHWLRAGLTPMQVLVAATQGSARVAGLGGQIGMVRPGMIADLLVVDGDPLWDIAALTRVALVMHNGRIIVPAANAAAEQCFPETGQCIGGRFKEYWEQNGGLAVFGFPLTPERDERNRDTGAVYRTQWFERARFELHPANARPYDVLLGRLGADRLSQRGEAWRTTLPPPARDAACLWFPQTRRQVCDRAAGLGFRTYWLTHGLHDPQLDAYGRSLALFGYPITDVYQTTNASGDTVLSQWFERARFEWHPNQPDQFKVLLGRLGQEVSIAP